MLFGNDLLSFQLAFKKAVHKKRVLRLKIKRKPKEKIILPKVLIQVGVSDLLKGLHVVDGNEVAVQVHKLDAHLLEGSLGQQVTLDPDNFGPYKVTNKANKSIL